MQLELDLCGRLRTEIIYELVSVNLIWSVDSAAVKVL